MIKTSEFVSEIISLFWHSVVTVQCHPRMQSPTVTFLDVGQYWNFCVSLIYARRLEAGHHCDYK